MSRKKKDFYIAITHKGGCGVINIADNLKEYLYYFAYTANQNENADAERAMNKIAGMMNLLNYESLGQQMQETARNIINEYEHFKVK